MHVAELLSLFIVSITSSIIPIPTELPVVALIRSGEPHITVFAVLTIGSTLGALIGYCIGRYGLTKLGRIFHFNDTKKRGQVNEWFQKHGEAFLIVSPWIPVVSDLAPVVVGIEKYDVRKFFIIILIAKAIKAAVIILFLARLIKLV